MLFILWALLSAFIVFCFDLFSFTLGRTGWRRFVSTFVLFYAQVVLAEFTLGLLGLLTAAALVGLNLLVSGVILAVLSRRHGRSIYRQYALSLRRFTRGWVKDVRGDHLFLALLALAVAISAWVFFLGVLLPVTDFDGNAYHMTFIAQSIQNHNVFDQPTSIPWLAGYPKGGELVEMWSVIIPHNEALADLAQLPFVFLGIFALYELSLRVGVSKKDARFAPVLFLFLPIVINQAKSTYVDVILCALFFAALALAVQKKLSNLDLIILGICYSLLLAVKSTGLIFVLATVPFLLMNILVFKGWALAPDYWGYAKKLFLVIAPTVFGIYWYVKDLVSYGSPLYPFGRKILGHTIFPGQTFQKFIASGFSNASLLPNSTLQRIWFTWTEQHSWFGCLYNYDSTFAGLGPVWFVLLFPSILIGIIIAVRHRRYLFLAITAVLAIIFWFYPANFYSRYTMFIVAVGILAYGLVASQLGGKVRTFTRLAAIFLAYTVISTTFTLCNFSPQVIREQLTADHHHNMRGGPAYANTVGPAYQFLQSRVQPGETVTYDSRPYFVYALWRPDYKNKVIYLPSSSKSQWYSELKQQKVKYVFVTIGSKESQWLNPDRVAERIYKDKTYEIYQIY